MTREQALSKYTLGSGQYITTAGKFYGERIFVPHFWEKSNRYRKVRRVTDRDGLVWSVFRVTESDRQQYPELLPVEHVGIREEANVVFSWVMSYGYVLPN